MAVNIEEYVPFVKQKGLNSAKDGTLSGVLTFSGANTHSGVETHSGAETHSAAETHSGAETHTGQETGFRRDLQIYLTEATTLLTAAESNKVIVATKASATQTFTLPIATTKGLMFTFVCGDAGGEILITPNAADQISTQAAANGANVIPAAGTGIKNTAATNVKNDTVTLVSDGVGVWYTIAISGIWATQ